MSRSLLALALSAAAVLLLVPQAVAALQAPAPPRVEDAVSAAASVVAALLAGWYLMTALVALTAALLRGLAGSHVGRGGAAHRAAVALDVAVRRFGAPVLRRGLTLGVGVGLAVAAPPALASTGTTVEDIPADLRPGASVTEPAVVATPAIAAVGDEPPAAVGGTPAPPAAGPAAEPDRATRTVVAGDSLWQIAAAHLGPGTDDDAIAREWPRWYAANAATIGPDPHLIHPGQVLLAPSKEARP
ncbi:LysM peptidoglycan-binding domain-containing protein [Georgenia sp. MJ170]